MKSIAFKHVLKYIYVLTITTSIEYGRSYPGSKIYTPEYIQVAVNILKQTGT